MSSEIQPPLLAPGAAAIGDNSAAVAPLDEGRVPSRVGARLGLATMGAGAA
jgi:hypothetical protein